MSMKSEVSFKCTNYDCERYDKELTVEIPDVFIGKCHQCFKVGRLNIVHGEKEFNSSGSLVEYLKGLMKEEKLLNKIKKAGIADNEELRRIIEIENILDGAVCPCCNQKPTID